MKNLHLLPTEKPSRLHYWDGILKINNSDIPLGLLYQNIYITNDEVIKEGDWFIDDNNSLKRSYKLSHVQFANPKKIILTTDPQIIADGVQAIEDDFLEWFVKNPSCERIDVEKWFEKDSDKEYFIIIIPKEQSKQLDIKELNKLDDIEIEEMSNDWETISKQKETKPETLKEAYNKIYKEIDFSEFDFSSFAIGVKYQQEKSYSEEEVLELLQDFANEDFSTVINIKEWFNKFKNK